MVNKISIVVKDGFIEVDDDNGKCYVRNVVAINTIRYNSDWYVKIYCVSAQEPFRFYMNDKKTAESVADDIYNACCKLDQKRYGYRMEESE